jgi:hypothetical protein
MEHEEHYSWRRALVKDAPSHPYLPPLLLQNYMNKWTDSSNNKLQNNSSQVIMAMMAIEVSHISLVTLTTYQHVHH